jgi:preprotein translocase subunit SecE
MGFWARTSKFIQQTRDELNKVSFPSREDVINTTVIVVLNVIFFAIFLFLVDWAWVYILRGLEWLVGKIG